MTEEHVIREARVEDAEGFVRAHEAAWNATAGAIVGKSLEELMPFDARVEHYRAGVAAAPGDARAWVAEQSGEIVGVAVCRREGTAVELRDPGRSAGCGVVAVAESRRAEASPI
jgi:hypothetical protein